MPRNRAKLVPDTIALAICHPKLVVVVRWPAAVCSAWFSGLAAKYSRGGPKSIQFQIGLITAIHRAIPRPKMM
jgi:hypothetical protein